ncbi:MAG: glycosyltransferase family 2 protein, partial [Phycisphaerales bacterium]|nr:glycosyltransferase family 2 protein [Phycisphaerales bacterium]
VIPFINRWACVEIVVARPLVAWCDDATRRKTATVVLTVRDERENIEPMVRALPAVGAETEIVFVEGHSTDGTREEIERVQRAYPERDIRMLVQDGIGQGDAIRRGFGEARGDVVVLLEADQTSPAEDVLKAFEVVASGRADFVNGSRFIYPREAGSMPWLNVVGNWLFAMWFTRFLGRRTSDVLCGIKAIDRRQFTRIQRNWGFLGVDDPFGDFELIFGAARLGLRIGEVPTRYRGRQYGQPKTKFFSHGWMLLRMALRATVVFRCR